MSGQIAYHLEEVQKMLGDFVLRIHQLDIKQGESFCVLGPTGSGKTTLLRILSGLEPPTEGDVCFGDRPVQNGELDLMNRRRIAMVFQRPLLLRGSVRKNVEFPLRLRGQLHQRSEFVDAILEQLRLTPLVSQSARTLSGGQTQLVCLARALVASPDVLLLDEPTANLDPAHVALVEDTIREVQRQRGLTVVWATHNLFQVRRVADRVALMLDGQLVEVAATEPFFESPKDSRTADFVQGKMVY